MAKLILPATSASTDSIPSLPIEFHTKKSRILVMIFGMGILDAICIFTFLSGKAPIHGSKNGIIFGIVLTSLGMFLGIVNLFRKQLLFRLTEQGIDDMSGKLMVTWPEIKDASLSALVNFDLDNIKINQLKTRESLVLVSLKEPEKFLAQNHKLTYKLYMTQFGTPIILRPRNSGISAQTLVDWINHFAAKNSAA